MEKNILFLIVVVALSICICTTVLVSIFVIYAPEKLYIGICVVLGLSLLGGFLGILAWYPQRLKVLYIPDSEKQEFLEKGKVASFDGVLLTNGYFSKLLNARDYAIEHGFMWN